MGEIFDETDTDESYLEKMTITIFCLMGMLVSEK